MFVQILGCKKVVMGNKSDPLFDQCSTPVAVFFPNKVAPKRDFFVLLDDQNGVPRTMDPNYQNGSESQHVTTRWLERGQHAGWGWFWCFWCFLWGTSLKITVLMQARNMIGLSTWKVFKRRATGYDVPWEAFPGVACRSLCYTIFYILGDYYVDYIWRVHMHI